MSGTYRPRGTWPAIVLPLCVAGLVAAESRTFGLVAATGLAVAALLRILAEGSSSLFARTYEEWRGFALLWVVGALGTLMWAAATHALPLAVPAILAWACVVGALGPPTRVADLTTLATTSATFLACLDGSGFATRLGGFLYAALLVPCYLHLDVAWRATTHPPATAELARAARAHRRRVVRGGVVVSATALFGVLLLNRVGVLDAFVTQRAEAQGARGVGGRRVPGLGFLDADEGAGPRRRGRSNLPLDTRPPRGGLALREPLLLLRAHPGSHPYALLRVVTYDAFAATGWERTAISTAPVAEEALDAERTIHFPPETSPAEDRWPHDVATISWLAKPAPGLPVLGGTRAVRWTGGDAPTAVRIAADGTARVRPALATEASYDVEARPPVDRKALRDLRSDASVSPDPAYVERPVGDVAWERALGEIFAETGRRPAHVPASERALLVEGWLRTHVGYDRPVATDERGPARLLFAGGKPTCVQFATAMVGLLRSAGHPARLVGGYGGGEPQDDGTVLFRASHAHTWCEVFYEGAGWVEYDPTPALREAGPDDSPTPAPHVGGPLARALSFLRRVGAFLLHALRFLVLGLLAVAVGYVLYARTFGKGRRRGLPLPDPGDGGLPPPAWPPYARAAHALRGAGISRAPAVTLSELHARAAHEVPPVEGPLGRLTRTFERLRYGAVPPDVEANRVGEADANAVEEAARAARERRASERPPSR